MKQTKRSRRRGTNAPEGPTAAGSLPANSRVDLPHVAGGQANSHDSQPLESTVSHSAGDASGMADPPARSPESGDREVVSEPVAQVRRQARQLAARLRNKQRELDQREALLHSRMAQLDEELRTSRLWIRQRCERFQELEQQIHERRNAIEQQAAALAAADLAADDDFARRDRQLQKRERELDRIEQTLQQERRRVELREAALAEAERRWRAEVDQSRNELLADRQRLNQQRVELDQLQHRLIVQQQRRREALECHYQRLQRQLVDHDPADLRRDLQAAIEHWQGKQKQLDRQEAILASQLGELAREKKRFAAEVDHHHAQLATVRRTCDEQQQRVRQDLDRQRQQVREQIERLEQDRTLVERMRSDVAVMHRQALEMQLASEQLHARLQATHGSAKVTQQLTELRGRLQDSFELERRAVERQQMELQQAAEEFLSQQETLNSDREQLRQWLRRQQDELQQQATRLAAREHELTAGQQLASERERAWHQERAELQQQIRHWMAQARSAPTAPSRM